MEVGTIKQVVLFIKLYTCLFLSALKDLPELVLCVKMMSFTTMSAVICYIIPSNRGARSIFGHTGGCY